MSIEKPLETVDNAELFRSTMEPEPAQQEPTKEQQPEQQQERPRDEQGRFAAKTAADTPEQQQPTETAEQQQAAQQSSQDDQAAIPSWRLREVTQERNAEREARQRAEMFARDTAARLQAMEAELTQLRNPQKPPDFFENPEQATQAAVRQALESMVGPQLGQLRQTQFQLAQAVAETKFGADKVQAADDAFSRAVEDRTIDPADYHRVMNSPNIYAAAVDWHNRQQVMSTVGSDPEAWFNKRMETFLSDPKNQATVMERIRGTAQTNGNGSRQPTVQLPPSLSRQTGVAQANVPDDGDASDAALFRHAMR